MILSWLEIILLPMTLLISNTFKYNFTQHWMHATLKFVRILPITHVATGVILRSKVKVTMTVMRNLSLGNSQFTFTFIKCLTIINLHHNVPFSTVTLLEGHPACKVWTFYIFTFLDLQQLLQFTFVDARDMRLF